MTYAYQTPAFAERREGDLYRVWPDGTVQPVEDGAPYAWVSDDYRLVLAVSEEDANAAINPPEQ